MEKAGPLELFAALVDQLPLATREDLEWVVQSLRSRPEWASRLEKARVQAREMGFSLTEAPRESAATGVAMPEIRQLN
jgi:hypothetical protein